MRPTHPVILPAALVLLCLPGVAMADQPWSGLLPGSRAIDWTSVGATTPTGTIPSCAIQPAAQTLTALNTAIAADVGGPSYCVIDISSWGTVDVSGTITIAYAGLANVILRGAGPNRTVLNWTGEPSFNCNGLGPTTLCVWNESSATNAGGGNWPHSASVTGGYAQNSSSLTLSSFSNLKVGDQIQIAQADPASDNGGLFACATVGANGDCSQQGASSSPRASGTGYSQSQLVTVSVCGASTFGAACTSGSVTISPGLYAPNWSSGQNMTAWWGDSLPISHVVVEGLELNVSRINMGILVECHDCSDVTFQNLATVNSTVAGQAGSNHYLPWQSNHVTIANSYMVGSNDASSSYGIDWAAGTSDSLAVNNICQDIAACYIMETAIGNVFAYNYAVDNNFPAGWQACDEGSHQAGDYYNLWEGNIGTCAVEDDIHGYAFANTHYRNYLSGFDPAQYKKNGDANPDELIAASQMAYARYHNYVGNVMGTAGKQTTYEYAMSSATDCGPGNYGGQVWELGPSDQNTMAFSPACLGTSFRIDNDLEVAASTMRWGNWDAVTGAVRVCNASSGAPCTGDETSSSAPMYPGLATPATTFPPSFYLAGAPPFWSFPAGTTSPWPPIGPDVAGGNIPGTDGHAYLNPAASCYLNVMGGQVDGTSGVLTFDPATCYPIQATAVDAGSDATVPSDGGAPLGGGDSGVAFDGSSGTPEKDGSARADAASPEASGVSGGCSCDVAGGPRRSAGTDWTLGLACALGASMSVRRRRRHLRG